MSTNIIQTTGKVLTTIEDYKIDDSSCSIILVGKNVINYGTYIESSLVRIMENFANTTSPSAPLTGQLWFNTNSDKLNYYNNGWNGLLDSNDLSTINGEISTINEEISTINGELSTINGEISTINGRLGTIDGEISTINGEISNINSQISGMENSISSLQGEITTINSNISTIQDDLNSASEKVDNLPTKLSELEDVSISSPANSQILTYNSTDEKWENKNLDIPIDPDTDNLLQMTSNGLLVELKAAADVSNQYVSSSTGNDTTGDGTQENPYKTLRKALNNIPDNTSVSIWLKSGDTFTIEDGADGYVENGTLDQIVAGGWNIGNRTLYIAPYGNDLFDKGQTTPGIDTGEIDIGTQPIIEFTYSKASDQTNMYVGTGFFLNTGSMNFVQIGIKVNPDNLPDTPVGAAWGAPFSPDEGKISFNGCDITLANAPLVGAGGMNACSTTFVFYFCYYDTTNGGILADAMQGISLKAGFYDVTEQSSILVNGVDTGLKTKLSNFNSEVAHADNFINFNVIDAASRTYEGLITQNLISTS